MAAGVLLISRHLRDLERVGRMILHQDSCHEAGGYGRNTTKFNPPNLVEEVLKTDLLYVAAYCLGGLVFAMGPFIAVYFLSARRTRAYANKTDQAVECGIAPIGDAWIRYAAAYYLYALVFVAFAVDVLYLIPVAIVYNRADLPIRDLVEVVIFVGILSLVVVYAWKKGVFEWKRKDNNRADAL